MKKLFGSLAIIFLVIPGAFAQDWIVTHQGDTVDVSQMSKKEWRAFKKEQRRIESAKKMVYINEILQSQQWVVETHTLQDRYGQTYNMPPGINFVGIDNEDATVQLGTHHLVGYNGVGGVTLDGKVISYEVIEGKRNAGPTVRMRVMGSGVGSASLTLTVNSSGQARIQINGDFGGRVTYIGQLVPLGQSSVYKGAPLF